MSAIQTLVLGALGGGTLGAVVVAWLKRDLTGAQADESSANAKKTDVETLRQIIAEVRSSEAAKAARIDSLELRIDKLEERERHALTRAAVHEAWDQLAFQALLATNQAYPPPPPLSAPEE